MLPAFPREASPLDLEKLADIFRQSGDYGQITPDWLEIINRMSEAQLRSQAATWFIKSDEVRAICYAKWRSLKKQPVLTQEESGACGYTSKMLTALAMSPRFPKELLRRLARSTATEHTHKLLEIPNLDFKAALHILRSPGFKSDSSWGYMMQYPLALRLALRRLLRFYLVSPEEAAALAVHKGLGGPKDHSPVYVHHPYTFPHTQTPFRDKIDLSLYLSIPEARLEAFMLLLAQDPEAALLYYKALPTTDRFSLVHPHLGKLLTCSDRELRLKYIQAVTSIRQLSNPRSRPPSRLPASAI